MRFICALLLTTFFSMGHEASGAAPTAGVDDVSSVVEIELETPDADLTLEQKVLKLGIYFGLGSYAIVSSEAEPLLADIETQRSRNDPLAGEVHFYAGIAAERWGRYRSSLNHLRKARAILEKHDPAKIPRIFRTRGDALLGIGRFNDAYTSYKNALTRTKSLHGYDSLEYAAELLLMSDNELTMGKGYRRGSSYAAKAARIRAKILGENDPSVAHAYVQQATMFMSGRRDSSAIRPMKKAISIFDAGGPDLEGEATNAREVLALVYERLGKDDKAKAVLASARTQDTRSPVPIIKEIPPCPLATKHGSWGVYEFAVDEDGRVQDLKFADGSPKNFALRSIRNASDSWRYRPATRNGKPVRTEGVRWSYSCATDQIQERNSKQGGRRRVD